MKTNLRSMIDDALDGDIAYEGAHGYYSGHEMPNTGETYDTGVLKLAQALNYVSANLNDLGTTEEKLAELALLQEKIADAATETAAKAGDTFGDAYTALKDQGLGKAWEGLSTGRKWVAGGTAGLVGLGALYGGYKLLSGNDGNRTTVIKNASLNSLDAARARAIVKLADAHGMSQWEYFDKVAASAALHQFISEAGELKAPTVSASGTGFNVTGAKPLSGTAYTTREEAEAAAKQFQDARLARRAKSLGALIDTSKLDDANKAIAAKLQKGEVLTSAERQGLISHLSGNTGAVKSNVREVTLTGGDKRVKGGATRVNMAAAREVELVDTTGNKIKYVVPGKYKDVSDAALQEQFKAGKLPADVVAGDLATARSTAAGASATSMETGRKNRAAAAQTRKGNAQTQAADFLNKYRGARMVENAPAGLTGPQLDAFNASAGRAVRKGARGTLGVAGSVSNITAVFDTYSPAQKMQFLGMAARNDPGAINAITSHTGMSASEAVDFAKEIWNRANNAGNLSFGSSGQRVANTKQKQYAARGTTARPKGNSTTPKGTPRPVGPDGKPTRAPLAPPRPGKTVTDAANKAKDEAGFFARNRRALYTAGGLGAAGLAGYGLYRAMSGGGRSNMSNYEPPREAPSASYGGYGGGEYKSAGLLAHDELVKLLPNLKQRGMASMQRIAVPRGLLSGTMYPSDAAAVRAGRNVLKQPPALASKEKNLEKIMFPGGVNLNGQIIKTSEDRTSPARITAGPAAPFSGFDIRSQGGGPVHIDNPVALRAQQVRAMINGSMNSYVNNTGDGYNLDRYLGRFNQ